MSEIHTASDARRLARKKLPWMVFDYIDGAAGDGYAERLNRETLQGLQLQPRVLNDVQHRSLSVDVFGNPCQLPFGVSPIGMCNLSSPHADRWLAEFAARKQVPVGVSTAASTSLETMAEWSEGQAWFQLYFSGNEESSMALIDRARKADYKTLVMTVDVPEVGRRPRELRRGFKMPFSLGPRQFLDFAMHPLWSVSTLINGRPQLANFGGEYGAFERTASRAGADWSLLQRIRDVWQGRLVIKGVLDVDDAKRMQGMGVDAIQVSSHGGRQLNSAPPPINCLGQIRSAVGPEFPLFYDSGLRSGEDIIKAYAMGANYVFLARPLLFAMAADGQQGLTDLVTVLQQEISITLAQLGVTSMQALSARQFVSHGHIAQVTT